MSNTAYIGSGTTLSSKYYLRSFYRSNREAGTSSKRREFSGNQLALADGRALRQAVRRLTSSDFRMTRTPTHATACSPISRPTTTCFPLPAVPRTVPWSAVQSS